ncbi:amidase family protein (plasmid) [Pseudomonas silvicola]|nr:amidase family protein [Pseudomonas silvicola]
MLCCWGKPLRPSLVIAALDTIRCFLHRAIPQDLSKTPGGSSAGSGAALAARLCPMALGSDGGGSVRIQRRTAAFMDSRPRWEAVPLWPIAALNAFPASLAGNHWSILAP